MTKTSDIPSTYEAARDELARVVDALEAGGLTLDDSLTLWERGHALATACEKFLAGAKERVATALAAAENGAEDTAVVGADAANGAAENVD